MNQFLNPVACNSVLPSNNGEKRSVTILGSTGSIGTASLKLLSEHEDLFCIQTLTAHENVDLLIEQCHKFKPVFAVIGNEAHYERLREGVSSLEIQIASGKQGLLEAGERPADVFIAAIVGAAGLPPTLKALTHGTRIALANKECLVCGGDLFMATAKSHGTSILPVDSEHSGIYQALVGHDVAQIEKVILTASGGPFRSLSQEALKHVTLAQALKHPNWAMGAKITIDSATMMNKGLELIEAYHLFGLETEKLDAIIHPQSIVHAIVTYKDGSSIAQLGQPDMCAPIAYALHAPSRLETQVRRLDFTQMSSLSFEAIDENKFPAVALAKTCMGQGGLSCILNSANEAAVEAFLNGKITYLDIASICERTLDALQGEGKGVETLEEILNLDQRARDKAWQTIENFMHSS